MNLLLDSALKATFLLAAAWIAAFALRRASADVRHLIWLVATLAVAALPAILAIPPSAIPAGARIVVPALATTLSKVTPAPQQLPWLLIVWAAGASFVLLRLLLGLAAAARITRSSNNVDGILYSEHTSTPITWGFLHPVVILPAYASAWPAAERALVIRHESAHIARRDWLWQTLASLATAVFWFHPLMWLANIQLRREAESAVDDRVLLNGAVPSDYAGCLVDVARHLRGLAAPSVAIAMVRKPELETRVRSILDPSRNRAGAGFWMRSLIAVVAVALILPVALTRQSVHAQGRVYKIGNGVSQPSVIYKQEPAYTLDARDAKIEGTVMLYVEIAPDGMPQNIRVTRSLDPGLDTNAISAVSNWRFNPGKKDGQPVTVAATIEVTFHLL